MTALVWPMSFAEWRSCLRCGANHVGWSEHAVPVDTDEEFGLVCQECAA